MAEKRDLKNEFADILTVKDCGSYSKTAKSYYEDALYKMQYTLRDLENKLNNGEYTRYQPEIDDKVLGYYESVIGSFKSAFRNFITTGEWNYTAPTTSQETKDKFNTFMDDVVRPGSFSDGRPATLITVFEKIVKNLKKNNFSSEGLAQKKAEAEEAKKPKLPETVSYTKSESYDASRMNNYKANSRGEQMALNSFLTNRYRSFQYAKQYPQYPEISEYLNKVFNALDNAWFAYISKTTDSLDFTEANSIHDEYTGKYNTVKQFDNKVCSARMVVGGSFNFWSCKDALTKMAANREKLIKTVTMATENTYEKWEASVDAILNEDGKPSLNAYLDNWVEEAVEYYTRKENVERWEEIHAETSQIIKDCEAQMEQIREAWIPSRVDKTISWRQARESYKDTPAYQELAFKLDTAKERNSSNFKYLRIARMGESKIREFFKEQAANAKKSFITAVCERAGVLQSGVFYWSEQNTGHLNGTVVGADGKKWKITSFFAGGYNIQQLHTRTKITELVR